MLCESCSQRTGKFHQNGIVLIISPLSALMADQIEEAERLKMDTFGTEYLHKGIQETPGGGYLWFDVCLLLIWTLGDLSTSSWLIFSA